MAYSCCDVTKTLIEDGGQFVDLGEDISRSKTYTGCPKKNYTLFDFMQRKTYKRYFIKTKSIPFTED